MSISATGIWARRTLSVCGVLGATAILAAPESAQAISCGATLHGGSWALTEDLDCSAWPAPSQNAAVLTIEGPAELDLGDHTILCPLNDDDNEDNDKTLAVSGIQVGGAEAYIHDGRIENCRRGVVVSGEGSHVLKRLTVTSEPELAGAEPLGFLVASDHNRLIRNTVEAFAGEGFRVAGGSVNMLKHNRATDNGDHGFRVRKGRGNVFLWNTALRNVGEGFRSQGPDTRFEANTAEYNGDEGFRLKGTSAQNNLLVRNTARFNGLSPCNPLGDNPDVNPGIAVTDGAGNNKIKNNKSNKNCIGIGVEEGSRSNKVVKNKASNNNLIDMVDGNSNCKGNEWRRNDFRTGASGPFPPGVPLAPCLRLGRLANQAADQAGDVVDDGKSIAKKAGSAAKDAIDSLF